MIKNRVTILRGKAFNVHTSGYVRLIEKGGSVLGRSIELPRGEKIRVRDLDFYTNRVIASWKEETVSVDYEFILRNTIPEGPVMTQAITAIEAIEIENEDQPVCYIPTDILLMWWLTAVIFLGIGLGAGIFMLG